jgi:hypothetical protein
VQLVRALAADLDRGGGRDRQLDLTPEGLEPSLELRRFRSLEPLHHLALGVARGGSGRQVDVREIALVESDE